MMLVLTRRPEQRIAIDTAQGRIWIVVLGFECDRVKLGFEAPADINIVREEVLPHDEATIFRKIGDW